MFLGDRGCRIERNNIALFQNKLLARSYTRSTTCGPSPASSFDTHASKFPCIVTSTKSPYPKLRQGEYLQYPCVGQDPSWDLRLIKLVLVKHASFIGALAVGRSLGDLGRPLNDAKCAASRLFDGASGIHGPGARTRLRRQSGRRRPGGDRRGVCL